MSQIGFLCSSSSWGGLEMNIVRNAKWMQDRGHQVVFFCVENTPIHSDAKEKGLTIIPIKRHRKYYDLFAAQRLIILLEKHQITHLFIRDKRDMSICASVKAFMKRPIVITYFMAMQLGVEKKNKLHTYRFNKLDHWICTLEWLKSQTLSKTNIDPAKVTVIPPALDLEAFETVWSKSEARRILGLPTDKKIVGIVGRFDEHKGQLKLLEALVGIKDPSIHVCLLGEPTKNEGDEYYKKITSFIKNNQLEERVHILPFRKDISIFYYAIDVFVMATFSETFGMVTIESMACGTPVLGSSKGGTPEILGNGKYGKLFDATSVEDLRKKLIETDFSVYTNVLLKEAVEKYEKTNVLAAIEKLVGIEQ